MNGYRNHMGPWHGGHGGPGLLGLLLLLVVVALAVFAVVSLLRFGRGRHEPPPPHRAPAGPAEDAALRELRLRYARGEVEREDFLRKLSDLGGRVPDGPQMEAT